MNIAEYDGKTAAAFFNDFIGSLKQYPLGDVPKRDLDCLIFFLLKKHNLIPKSKHSRTRKRVAKTSCRMCLTY